MTIELNSEEVATAVSEYAIRKLGGSGKYKAQVTMKCEPREYLGNGGTFTASVTLESEGQQ